MPMVFAAAAPILWAPVVFKYRRRSEEFVRRG
jgi:hypothetical protein